MQYISLMSGRPEHGLQEWSKRATFSTLRSLVPVPFAESLINSFIRQGVS